MVDTMIMDGTFIILAVIIAVNSVSVIRDFIRWHRNTSRTILKTHRTVHELRKIIESRSGMGRTH